MHTEMPHKFEYPQKIEKILASLAAYYRAEDQRSLLDIITNSRYAFEEGYTYDNWDGGIWGHILHLYIPLEMHSSIFNSIESIEKKLCEDINRIAKIDSEFLSNVSIEILDQTIPNNWRGTAAIKDNENIPDEKSEETTKIWEPEYLRAFISHTSVYKNDVSQLKTGLLGYGISGFVAHEDIEPTQEWQQIIELALSQMEVMIPYLTEGFHSSNWTDQEIGAALGRKVPVISIKIDIDPYGFIGKFQAIKGSGKLGPILAEELFQILITMDNIMDRAKTGLIKAFENSDSFADSNKIIKRIARLDNLPINLIDRLAKAPEINGQVEGAYDVERILPGLLDRFRRAYKI
jgi:hypothetical protein